MTDSKPEGFQPAPWEAGGKKKTQGPQPQNPAYGGPQANPPGYPPPPPPQASNRPTQSVPLGGGPAPNAFGGDDMGRARTRQIPNQQPAINEFQPRQTNAGPPAQPPAYGAAPPPQQGAYAPPPQGQQPYPPAGPQPGGPQQPYPPAGPPPAGPQPGGPQQPYAETGFVAKKPVTVLGIISLVLAGVGCLAGLVSFGLFSWPFFIGGGVLGYVAIRETAAWGKKSGRGLAMGGTIANGALLLLNIVGVIALFAAAGTLEDIVEQQNNATMVDGPLIVERIGKYKQAKGDLQPGGPQMQLGFEQATAVTGAQLTVPDLCRPTELKNPIEQYSLVISEDTATVWWTPPEGQRMQVGEYPAVYGFDDWDWESDFE